MSKFIVTLGASTGSGAVTQSCCTTATLNGKPIATVGSIATHPYGTDVLVEGVPTILLNGMPIAFSTGKTALGGALLPNTSVKIIASDTYTGFEQAPRIDTVIQDGPPDEAEESATEAPVVCENLKLISDYAQQQLIHCAKIEKEAFFEKRMARIYGKDVSVKAYQELYKQAFEGTVSNPEIVVCKNRIYGVDAAYSNKDHKIYVSEQIVRSAIEDNEVRHQLMAALVEEYGHHIDYLLRYEYDTNENKDAKGDEGARFAYQGLYYINYIDELDGSSASFATAETDEGTFELAWEYESLKQALERYTAHRQEGTDDHLGNGMEGFKVEDLGKENGYGHENIQEEAVRESQNKLFIENIDLLYRGNWLRDYSQLLAPLLINGLGKVNREKIKRIADAIAKGEKPTDDSIFDAHDSQTFNDMFPPETTMEFIKDIIRLLVFKKFQQDTSEDKSQPENTKTYIMVEELKDDFNNWRKHIDGDGTKIGLIPGFEELLGVSAPHDHFDNPFGLEYYKDLFDLGMGFNGKISPEETEYNTDFGMKNYIRQTDCGDQGNYGNYGTKVVYGYLLHHLNEVWDVLNGRSSGSSSTATSTATSQNAGTNAPHPAGAALSGAIRNSGANLKPLADISEEKEKVADSVEKIATKTPIGSQTEEYVRAKNMVKLGGLLHTIQDFYAHSNYSEAYVVKCWYDGVITWSDADHCREYNKREVFVNDGGMPANVLIGNFRKNDKYANNLSWLKNMYEQLCGPTLLSSRYPGRIEFVQNAGFFLNKKAFFTPITTGTYDMEDMMATGVIMLKHLFPTQRNIFDDEKKAKKGERTASDIRTMIILKYLDERAATEEGSTQYSEYFERYLEARDEFIGAYEKDRSYLFGNSIADVMETLGLSKFRHYIAESIKIAINTFVHKLINFIVALLEAYQLSLKNNMDEMLTALKDAAKEQIVKGYDSNRSPKEQAKMMEASLKKVAKQVLWAKYPTDNNPSHTMLAKDEASHPVNPLSGEMAVSSTLEMLTTMTKGKETVEGVLKDTITHPLLHTRFDALVADWGRENFGKVLSLSVSSMLFEVFRAGLQLVIKTQHLIEQYAQDEAFCDFVTNNRFHATDDSDLPQKNRNAVGEATNYLKAKFNELIDAYKASEYREMDGNRFLRLYEHYIDNGGKLTDKEQHFVDAYKFLSADKEAQLQILANMRDAWMKELDRRLDHLKENGVEMHLDIPDLTAVVDYFDVNTLKGSLTEQDPWARKNRSGYKYAATITYYPDEKFRKRKNSPDQPNMGNPESPGQDFTHTVHREAIKYYEIDVPPYGEVTIDLFKER